VNGSISAQDLKDLAERWQREHPECGPIVAVDGAGSADDVERRVLAALTTHCPDLLHAGARA